MTRSGLLIGLIVLVLSGILAFFSSLCVPCLALFAGLAAGYLAGVFDRPPYSGHAARLGAGSGAIGGLGALGGHLVGGLASATVIGPEGAADLMRQLGLPLQTTSDPGAYYFGAFGAACCFGLFEVMLMAGLGALGGLIWFQIAGAKAGTPPTLPV